MHISDWSSDVCSSDLKQRTVNLTEKGNEKVETLLREQGVLTEGSLYDIENITIVHHVQNALKAHKLFQKDKDYIVQGDKVLIIDEFTGRMMEGRRYYDGLHQALEAKEHVRSEERRVGKEGVNTFRSRWSP